MSQATEFKRVSLQNWEVESLRATAFHDPDTQIASNNWWSESTNTEPETQVVQSKFGERRYEGSFAGGKLTLLLRPGRIDWLLGADIGEEQEKLKDAIPSAGQFDVICPTFTELIERWLTTTAPKLSRLAFGATVLLPVTDRVAGYKQLSSYLPSVELDAENSSELLYRINRPRYSQSADPELRLNRLSTWSVAAFDERFVSMTGDQTTVVKSDKVFACRIEVDINTSPDYSHKFVPPNSSVLFKELVNLGMEVIDKGDVA